MRQSNQRLMILAVIPSLNRSALPIRKRRQGRDREGIRYGVRYIFWNAMLITASLPPLLLYETQ